MVSTSCAGSTGRGLGWISIIRLGLVQAALGSIIVLTTSTLNRVMMVELSLAAIIPGLLVGWHYAIQISRPLWGHQSDRGGGRTRWIIGGMAILATGGLLAAASPVVIERNLIAGLALAFGAFTFIGLGVGACGTSLLALLADRTAVHRRPAAATIVWMMMIGGIVVTAIVSGLFLDPFSFARLIIVTGATGLLAFLLTCLAVWGIERHSTSQGQRTARPATSFFENLKDTWADPEARLFTVFVFMSMLAYSTQDLILEPFGGLLFGLTPGETTKLSGLQHGGVLLGMALVGVLGTVLSRRKPLILRLFTVWGCVASAAALAALAFAATVAPNWPLAANIFTLGLANGAFAVAAIGSMMMLAGGNGGNQTGIRMGVWGAAQALSFGLGGFAGTVLLDLSRLMTGDDGTSFLIVFSLEAVLFLLAALVALRIKAGTASNADLPAFPSPGLEPAE
ncbi:bacteriochlorophyll synthase [Roseibium aquae]|uniref:Bacteriochlorophyll synthase n=1 Tax=Roseibium aquae TaxID=1323746 RepID=A0A916WVN0_9HYPH|nr:BCD family MFS transporter [Roseibium aquae]GGB33656.1 bacteriochlorophyll synthase [Roseibium aquae]